MWPCLPWEAGVNIVGKAKMIGLNRDFRGKNCPTDVLSFSSPEIFKITDNAKFHVSVERSTVRGGLKKASKVSNYLGDLVICLPVLKKQAKQFQHSELYELKVLLVHGLLHLLGCDHEKSKRQADEMARLEARLLTLQTLNKGTKRGLIKRSI